MENTTTKNPLLQKIEASGLLPATVEALQQHFQPFYDQAERWRQKAEALVVSSAEQTKEMQDAREARLALKNIRVAVEKKRKELKEDSLRTGQTIDSVANVIKSLIEPIESHLEEQENFISLQEEKRKAALQQERASLLAPYNLETAFYDLKNMPEGNFQTLLESTKVAFEKKVEDDRKAEIERQQRLEQEAKDKEALRLENERLRKESQLREAEVKKQREASDKKLREEREKKAKLERELQAKRDEEAKVERERLERERLDKLAERRAKAAPDKKKLLQLAETLETMEYPEMKSDEAKVLLSNVKGLMFKVTEYIKTKTETL